MHLEEPPISESPGSDLQIGLVPQGGRDWIAGVIYLENLLRALHSLPGEERPSLSFLVGPGTKIEEYRDLSDLVPSFRYYAFRSTESFGSRIRSAIKLRNFARRLQSLERLAENANLSVLFPLQASLGYEFPRPWIGWIPDFQHKRLPQFFSKDELQRRDKRFEKLIQEAHHLVVSSEEAHQDLLRWSPHHT